MLHIALHFVVPALLAGVIDRDRWLSTWLILVGTMVVDLDHLLADPVYDPARCSIGFHPLHSVPAIASYGAMLVGALGLGRHTSFRDRAGVRWGALIALGLLLHMALDGIDCVL